MSREVLRVTLTPEECAQAIEIGRARHAEHERAGRLDTRIDPRAGVKLHIQGALAEKGVAVALKLEWDGAFRRLDEWLEWRESGGDVGGGIQVKATDRPDGCLLLQKHNDRFELGGDPRAEAQRNAYVLVLTLRSTYPTMFLIGWRFGDEARQPTFWDARMPRPCWRVHQHHLRSIRSLAKFFPRDRKRTKWVTECQREPLPDSSKPAASK
jgi:hypothetical protein